MVECLKEGIPLDQNVYEGCFWSAVSPLSEISVSQGGMPQKFPDFTRGRWVKTKPLHFLKHQIISAQQLWHSLLLKFVIL